MTIRIVWSLAALIVSALLLSIGLVAALKNDGLSAEAKSRFLGQISSGRWVLTVMAGVCLLLLTLALVVKGPEFSISGEALVAILSTVFTSYFYKDRMNGNGNGHDKPSGPQGPAE